MKKILGLTFLFLNFFVLSVFAAQQVDVVAVQGDCEVKRLNGTQWEQIQTGMKLEKGDKISTGYQSTVKLAFEKNSVVTVQPLTQFTIREFSEASNKVTTDLDLKVGKVQAKVNKGPDFKSAFSVSTPSSVVSVRGTEKVVGESDGGTHVQTLEGHVGSANQQGEQAGVDQGQSSDTSGAHNPPTQGVESSHDASRSNATTNTGITDGEEEENQQHLDALMDPGTYNSAGNGASDTFQDIFETSHNNQYQY